MSHTWFGPLGVGRGWGSRPGLSRVLPRLLVGEYPMPADAPWLRQAHGVTAVLSLQDDADLASKRLSHALLERSYRTADIRFDRVPVADADPEALAVRLPAIVGRLGTLLAGGEHVLLHCNAGMNRAPTAAIAYVVARFGFSIEVATGFVKRRRPCVPYVRALALWVSAEPIRSTKLSQ